MTKPARSTVHGRQFAPVILGVLMVLAASVPDIAAQTPAQVSAEQFARWMKEISNWGRWGPSDERGTLNLITADTRRAAAELVRDGVSVSLARDLDTQADSVNTRPFEHTLTIGEFGGHTVAGDIYSVQYHGFAHSHIDGLPHFAHRGLLYNGFPVSGLRPTGADKLGIHNAADGIVTRGVLVDMAAHRGVDYLEPGTAITVDDLEAWERSSGVRLGRGDVLLLRTGRWEAVRQQGPWHPVDGAAGLHASVALWLKARDIAVIGSDAVSDVMPSNVEGLVNPLHELVLVGLGMPILDNLDLEALSREAQERGRWTFLFIGAPLRVRGGTGSPLNPLAVF